MSNRTPHPKFTLHLEALPRHGDDNGMRRLRALLKTLLRGWGMRCKRIDYPGLEHQDQGAADADYAVPFVLNDSTTSRASSRGSCEEPRSRYVWLNDSTTSQEVVKTLGETG